jgi:hypothetical protein
MSSLRGMFWGNRPLRSGAEAAALAAGPRHGPSVADHLVIVSYVASCKKQNGYVLALQFMTLTVYSQNVPFVASSCQE